MKKMSLKLISLFITMMMATIMLPAQMAQAETTPDGMFTYTVSEGNATITGLVDESYSGPLTIPSTINDGADTYNVTEIDDSAFYDCDGLTGVTLGNSLTSIGWSAFEDCEGLTGSITIPASVTNIGGNAFLFCSSLTDINVSTENTEYSSKDGILYDKLQSELISCPAGKAGAITIPDSVTDIGRNAFMYCRSLTDINVSTENSGYSSEDGVLYDKSQTELITYPAGKTGSFTIPASVTSIGDYAFAYCSGLTDPLTIPASVIDIGRIAFIACSGLTEINVSEENPEYSSKDGILYDKSQTELIACPAGKKGHVTIPDSVMYIGDSAFEDCEGLTGLTIGNNVTSIGDSAFYNCSGLTGPLTIPSSVIQIGVYAFYNCSGLTKLTIGKSVTSIGDYAFGYCSTVKSIVAKSADAPSAAYSAFFEVPQTTVLYTPNTPAQNSSYGYLPWSYFVRGGVEPTEYEVTFDSNGGSAVASQTIASNEKVLEPAQPSKAGYAFAGWYADKALTESFDFNTPITKSITLYAKWILEPVDTVISGTNRFDTAALISKQLNDSAETVLLTTGRNFPDALSAGPLAVQINAPILLSEVNKLPKETLDEIKRLGASKVIILGGQEAIDSSVEEALTNLGISVERISGNTRFLTAIETAKRVRASSGQLERAILVNGYGFADALSIGSKAAKAGIPILLTTKNSLSPDTKKAIVEFGIKKIDIIGGEQAVSKAVEDELAGMGISVSRISGSSRFATSAAIAGKYFADSKNAIISNGRGFVDALAAVPLAVEEDAPILLVEKESLPMVISDYLDSSSINRITIVGGELAVSSKVRTEILNVLKK